MPDIFVAPKESASTPPSGAVADKEEPVEPVEQKGSSLSAYALYPDGVHFDTQAEEERIILLLRKHWITNLPWLVITFSLIFAPPIVFPAFFLRQILPSLPGNFVLVATIFWYLATFGFALVNFIVWYFNVYIVTDERIIDVDFLHLLYKQLSSTRIARIQDLTYKLGGVIRSLFDFGDVFIQTAGTELNFEFEAVPHPEAVVRKISELMEKGEEKPLGVSLQAEPSGRGLQGEPL